MHCKSSGMLCDVQPSEWRKFKRGLFFPLSDTWSSMTDFSSPSLFGLELKITRFFHFLQCVSHNTWFARIHYDQWYMTAVLRERLNGEGKSSFMQNKLEKVIMMGRKIAHLINVNFKQKSYQIRSGQVTVCLTCTFRASCCSARLSWVFLCPGQVYQIALTVLLNNVMYNQWSGCLWGFFHAYIHFKVQECSPEHTP